MREEDHAKFLKLANARVNKAVKMIELISNLSDVSNYQYTAEETDKIFSALDEAIKKAKVRFDQKGEEAPQFTL